MTRTFLTPIVLPADPITALEAATKQYVDAHAGGGGSGTTILDGADPPTAGDGAAGDYYEDTTDGVLYGPKSATGYGVEQRITVPSSPDTSSSNADHGVKVQFLRDGRITKIRYQRTAGSAGTLTLRVWNDDASGAKIFEQADAQTGAGAFEITLGTPLIVAANAIRTFSVGASGDVPYKFGSSVPTDTADCAFLGYVYAIPTNNYPTNPVTSVQYYVEPTFEADEAWPVTVRSVPGAGSGPVDWADITGKPSTFAPSDHDSDHNDVYAVIAHTHPTEWVVTWPTGSEPSLSGIPDGTLWIEYTP